MEKINAFYSETQMLHILLLLIFSSLKGISKPLTLNIDKQFWIMPQRNFCGEVCYFFSKQSDLC